MTRNAYPSSLSFRTFLGVDVYFECLKGGWGEKTDNKIKCRTPYVGGQLGRPGIFFFVVF